MMVRKMAKREYINILHNLGVITNLEWVKRTRDLDAFEDSVEDVEFTEKKKTESGTAAITQREWTELSNTVRGLAALRDTQPTRQDLITRINVSERLSRRSLFIATAAAIMACFSLMVALSVILKDI